MATLLLVLAIMGGVLWMSVAMHHRVNVLLKHSQMQWSLTQSFWTAEAGLECAYSQLKHNGNLSHTCGLVESSIQLVTTPNGWLVRSKSGNITVTKEFNDVSQQWVGGSWIDY